MTYETAVTKAWDALDELFKAERFVIPFLADTYDVNVRDRSILSRSCNVPTKDYLTILIVHYLTGTIKNGFSPSGEWVSFKDIEGGEIYYPAFRESVIKALLEKYGDNPKGLLDAIGRFDAKRMDQGDASIELATFPDIKVRVILWGRDEEFEPEATILFDRNLTKVYSTEDIVVFLRFVTHGL